MGEDRAGKTRPHRSTTDMAETDRRLRGAPIVEPGVGGLFLIQIGRQEPDDVVAAEFSAQVISPVTGNLAMLDRPRRSTAIRASASQA
jgi:hypothetical protein